MKKLLALVLILALCTGCASKDTSSRQNNPAQEPELSVTESPAPQEQEPLDLSAVEVAPGFYNLSALPQLQNYSITDSQLDPENRLFFLTGEKGEILHRLDLNTGAEETLCTIPVQQSVDWISTSLLSAKPLAVCQSAFSQEAVYLVDGNGRLTSLQAPEGMVIATWNTYFNDTDCIWLDTATYQLVASPLSGAPARIVAQIPPDYFYATLTGLTPDGDAAVLSANCGRHDSVYLTVDLSSGEITGVYVQGEDSQDLNILTGGVSHIARYDDDMALYTLTAQENGRQVTATFDLHTLSDPDLPFQGQDWWLSAYTLQPFWGKTLAGADHYNQGHWLLLWDYSGAEAEETEVRTPVPYVPPEPVSQDALEERIKALEETYGISIHTGEDVNAPYPDYTLEPCLDLDAAAEALNTLEQAFALYPEDYFRQLGGETIRGFSFYLCGRMTPLDPSSNIDNPGGLSCQVDGVELLAFDITSEVRIQDVVHELTHVLDHWLSEGDVLDEDRWAAMNPEDFSYYYSYVDPNGESYEWAGSTAYTAWDSAYYDGNIDSVWFVDPYSTTFPTEDRARLMEFLLADADYRPDYFNSIHVQAKLNYYFLCIREKFDDSNWPELTSWEIALGPVG